MNTDEDDAYRLNEAEDSAIDTDKIARQVAAAAAYLDTFRPGWEAHVNVATLDLASCANCVLGQLLGNYAHALAGMAYVYYGFGGYFDTNDRGVCVAFRAAWLVEIAKRRAVHGQETAAAR